MTTCPAKPPCISSPSPNHSRRPNSRIDTIVLHATAGGYEGSLAWLIDPRSRVSAHYLINKQGLCHQLVPDSEKAWHAGRSAFRGEYGVNAFSIGIELVNANDGRDAYPEEQVRACAELCAHLCYAHHIPRDRITSHYTISHALQGKTDPKHFPWERFSSIFREAIGDVGRDVLVLDDRESDVPLHRVGDRLFADADRLAAAVGFDDWEFEPPNAEVEAVSFLEDLGFSVTRSGVRLVASRG